MQQSVAEEVNRRMAKATVEIGEKYAAGKGGTEVSVDGGPTGTLYKEKHDKEMKEKREAKIEKQQQENSNAEKSPKKKTIIDDDDEEGGDDEDAGLRDIRANRLREIKKEERRKQEDLGKGHGQYRHIVQDDFIKEMTSSDVVICHFYHRDFPKCEIMHHHLQKLSQRHVETKFVKIDAEKTMFFVQKLSIRSMPTVCIFFDGLCTDKIIGYEGLIDEDCPEHKQDEWPTIRLARLLAEKGGISAAKVVDDDGVEKNAQKEMENLRSVFVSNATLSMLDDDDDDFGTDDED